MCPQYRIVENRGDPVKTERPGIFCLAWQLLLYRILFTRQYGLSYWIASSYRRLASWYAAWISRSSWSVCLLFNQESNEDASSYSFRAASNSACNFSISVFMVSLPVNIAFQPGHPSRSRRPDPVRSPRIRCRASSRARRARRLSIGCAWLP